MYLLLVAASWGVQWAALPDPLDPAAESGLKDRGKQAVELPPMGDDGPLSPNETGSRGASSVRLAYLRWSGPAGSAVAVAPPAPGETRTVILLHGSPGDADNLRMLGAMVAQAGFEVIAPDLPGFGDSTGRVPSYSTKAHARSLLGLMDSLGIQRAHVVGWSMGGGVALYAADLQPERFASVAMVGAIGDQAFEGSGSYWFEHVKYGVGYVALVLGPKVVPHFGLLGNDWLVSTREAFIRNFWDSDQRPLEGIMRRLAIPTLVLHGREDFLVPLRAAERHHELIAPSSLVITPYSHFMPLPPPMGQPAAALEHLTPFWLRHVRPGAVEERRVLDLSTRAPWFIGDALGEPLARLLVALPWWVVLAATGLACRLWPRLTTLVATMLMSAVLLDPGVGVAGLLLGAGARRWREREGEPPSSSGADSGSAGGSLLAAALKAALATIGAMARTLIVIIAAAVLTPTLIAPLGQAFRAPGLLVGMAPALLALAVVSDGLTRSGRWRLKTTYLRWRHHEFWPTWLLYAPLIPYALWLAWREGHALAFLCVNPGIEHGGGWIDESKHRVMQGLDAAASRTPGDRDRVAATFLVGSGESGGWGGSGGSPEERAGRALALMRENSAIGRFPVILKPDAGQRGHAVRLARSDADVLASFRETSRPVVVQQYCPGPCECGVFWVRSPERPESGRIYSITRKTFPVIEGDGVRTLEELIRAHPRFRMQAGVFLARLGARRRAVPARGERLRLGEAGNHAQGTMFTDGSDLITPALEAAINALSLAFPGGPGEGWTAGGFDFGRFDIRYASDDQLRRGEAFSIVELNGSSSEATALYDPSRGLLWALGLLLGQWNIIFRLGGLRRRAGARPPTLSQVLGWMRRHFNQRDGSPISD